MKTILTLTSIAMLAIVQADHALAQEHQHFHPPEHAQLHEEFYMKLQRPDAPPNASPWQKSCCSNRDCKPVQARYSGGHWEFLDTKGWRSVPDDKMLDVKSPDTRAHACVSPVTEQLLCFVKPDFGT